MRARLAKPIERVRTLVELRDGLSPAARIAGSQLVAAAAPLERIKNEDIQTASQAETRVEEHDGALQTLRKGWDSMRIRLKRLARPTAYDAELRSIAGALHGQLESERDFLTRARAAVLGLSQREARPEIERIMRGEGDAWAGAPCA
jgi:hypothetical protein